MPNNFNFAASPFDCLTAAERERVRACIDLARFAAEATILETGAAPAYLYIVATGRVRHFQEGEAVAVYGPDDCFDARGLLSGQVSGRFVAAEEVAAYRLPRAELNALIASNAAFGALLFSDLSNKLSAISSRQGEHELQSLMIARVRDAFVRPANFVDAATDVLTVVRGFSERRITNTLVRDSRRVPPRIGIFTTSNLQHAVLDGRPLDRLAVGELCSSPLVKVRADDHLFDALALMVRHSVHRVVVEDGGEISGVLEQLDLLSFLSSHSYLASLRILEAGDLATLELAAQQIERAVAQLFRGGARVGPLAKLVQELNSRLYERAWRLIAPPDLIANSCLFVMGSEGRGEQLLRTDQDNGLVLRDGFAPPADLAEICARFSRALAAFGYPPCPGDIMVTNPKWRQPAREFAQTAARWLRTGEADGPMAVSIFMDARAVCGDAALLESVRDEVFAGVGPGDASLRPIAAAVEHFREGGWWNRLIHPHAEEADLKKAGLFPLVHGVRTLALERHIRATGTAERIEALVEAGRLSRDAGRELVDSLHVLLGLRLKAGLAALELHRTATGAIEAEALSSLERALLKDALAAVRRFVSMLRFHFRLDAL